MSAIGAGSASNVSAALAALSQTVQQEHVAAAAVVQSANEAAKQTAQVTPPDPTQSVPRDTTRGDVVDIKA